MFVRWQTRTRRARAFGRDPNTDTHWAAILAESSRIDGKPTQRHIAYLGGITESAIELRTARFLLAGSSAASINWRSRETTARASRQLSKPRCRALPGASTTTGLFAGTG